MESLGLRKAAFEAKKVDVGLLKVALKSDENARMLGKVAVENVGIEKIAVGLRKKALESKKFILYVY